MRCVPPWLLVKPHLVSTLNSLSMLPTALMLCTICFCAQLPPTATAADPDPDAEEALAAAGPATLPRPRPRPRPRPVLAGAPVADLDRAMVPLV